MKTLTRKNLSDLAMVMLKISEREQRSYVGGGSGTVDNPYTIEDFERMSNEGTWNGGYVEGWGYTFPEVTSYGYYGGYYYEEEYHWNPGNPDPWGDFPDNGDNNPPGYYPGYGYSGDPGFPGDDSGYGNYGYGHNYDYNPGSEDPYDYGYYGGGSGNNNDNGHGDEDPQITAYREMVAELAPWLISEVGKLGIDISNVPIEYGDWCHSNARYYEGEIQICAKGLTEYDLNDLTSMVVHEAVHHRDDIPADMTPVALGEPLDLRNIIPQEFDDFLKERSTVNNDFFEELYLENVIFGEIVSPEYYFNEINAYTKEMELCPDVSAKYDVERRYMLWRYQQLYEHAINNYPQ